jgi:hypothetical protein
VEFMDGSEIPFGVGCKSAVAANVLAGVYCLG